MEARCEGLFKSLREAYEAMQGMEVKRNKLKRQRNEAKRDLGNAREDLLQAQAATKSFEDQREEERQEMKKC
jgi:chromosome segregation ATPase